ncbi:MAG TPA: c-type cytochrome, partial [Opitutaceae bacterium]|nr:c-type cytochrome [Opitutaceae bacterium]
AGEFARHAVLQLPADGFAKVEPLLQSLAKAPVTQRVALAEGLATVAAKPDRKLPPNVDRWMRTELIGALNGRDPAILLRAVNALKPLTLPEKAAPLGKVALDAAGRENVRVAAVRALAPDDAPSEKIRIEVLAKPGPDALRRAAADLLGTATPTPEARAALVTAFPSASGNLALSLAIALARSDAGAADLIEAAAKGRVRPTLLRHRHVALALEKRPAELRERAAALTAKFPPEDVRLDALIAQRMAVALTIKTDPARGAALFATHCATCHRFREQGGNLGPSLDGSASRSVARMVEDILDPSRNIDPAFRLSNLTLKNGETKSGLNLREQGDRVLLAEPATGQDIAIPRAKVVEITASPVSAMPPSFEALLSEQDLFDLIEYLRASPK